MRTKFENVRQPDYNEQLFIEKIEQYKRVKTVTMVIFVYGSTKKQDALRTIRKYIERYNNGLYENIIPLGKIITVNGFYTLVRSNHELANKVRRKAKYDLICAAINYHNTMKYVGKEVNDDQISIYDITNKSLAELINLAKEIETDL